MGGVVCLRLRVGEPASRSPFSLLLDCNLAPPLFWPSYAVDTKISGSKADFRFPKKGDLGTEGGRKPFCRKRNRRFFFEVARTSKKTENTLLSEPRLGRDATRHLNHLHTS